MPKNKKKHISVTTKIKKEVKDAFQKLFREYDDGRRDTSYWRKSRFCDVCSQSTNFSERRDVMTNRVDKLFNFEATKNLES